MSTTTNKRSLTTVKIEEALYESFKTKNVNSKFYLQDLVNRCMYLYINDDEFRKRIYEFNIPVLSDLSQTTVLNITGSTPE